LKKYIIFGAGAFLSDLFDLIHMNNGRVSQIYQNVKETTDDRVISLRERVNLLDYEVEVHPSLESFVKPDEEVSYVIGCLTVQKYKLVEELKQNHGLYFDSLIHPSVSLGSNVHIGEGLIINAGTVIAPNVYLDDFCSVNRAASIGHDTKIGKFSQVGPGVSLAGSCRIGNHSFIGIGACILDRLHIGDWAVIGAGSVVTKDIEESVVALGAPARKIRKNKNQDFTKYQATLLSS